MFILFHSIKLYSINFRHLIIITTIIMLEFIINFITITVKVMKKVVNFVNYSWIVNHPRLNNRIQFQKD